MKRNALLQGLLFGFMTGIIVTVFDGFFMVGPDIYVPPEYPLVLLVFNLILWMVFGCVAGSIIRLFFRRTSSSNDELYYRVLFYLIPFAALYGILGRFFLPHSEKVANFSPTAFDNNLSFVWVGLFLLFLLFQARRRKSTRPVPSSLLFIPELCTIIVLFQFCSNPDCFKILALAKQIQPDGSLTVVAALYLFGVAAVFLLYGVYFFKLRLKLISLFSRHRVTAFMAGIVFCGAVYAVTVRLATNENYTMRTVPAISVSQPGQKAAGNVPNIILVVFDTLRVSAVTDLKGTGFINNIEAFADDSLVFDNCIAAASFTLPSHASLFTGMYVSEHGCEKLFGAQYLADEFVTLAEKFRAYGYKTAAVTSNYGWLNETFNMLQGFEFVSSLKNVGINHTLEFRPVLNFFSYLTNVYRKAILPYRTADDINRTALEVTQRIQKAPFFLFLNYMDMHTPYRPPSPYNGLFLNRPQPQMYRLQQYYRHYRNRSIKEEWDEYILSQYYGELAYLDVQFGKLIEQLKARGLYDSSLIVVTSDHGEVFGERGYYEHWSPMFNGIANIPLFIKFPSQRKTGSTDKIINLVDLYPTILSICDMPIPDDISGAAFGDEKASGFAGLTGYVMYRTGSYKYMDAPQEGTSDLLFHLPSDPDETKNLNRSHSEVFSALKKTRNTLSERFPLRYNIQTRQLPDQAREGLKSLGYIQ